MSTYALPLFPLNIVMFPGGQLPLRIFETRYLDMVRGCLRNKSPFGLINTLPEGKVSLSGLPFYSVGTVFSITEADVTEPGMMNIRCLGERRFRVRSTEQKADGLWTGQVEDIDNDQTINIPEDLQPASMYLRQLLENLAKQGLPEHRMPFAKPYLFEDCAWVSSRWCEILAIPIAEKQNMLELDSPLVRLELINDWIQAELAINRN